MREPHRRVQERFPRRPFELSPFPGQRLPPAPARGRLQPGQLFPSPPASALALGSDRNSACLPVQNRRPHPPDRPLHPHPSGLWLALAGSVSFHRPRPQQQLTSILSLSNLSHSIPPAEPCPKISVRP